MDFPEGFLFSLEEEYKKNKKLKKQDIDLILQWLKTQPHLPKLTEHELVLFLQSCRHSTEYTKQVIDIFYTCRTHCPELFADRQTNISKKWFDMVLCTVLPEKLADGSEILYVKVLDFDMYNFANVFKISGMVGDLHYLKNGTNQGLYTVFDMEGSQISHFMKTSPLVIKKAVYYLQEAMPVLRKQTHFINAAPFIDKVIALIKSFVKSDIMEMLEWHSPENMDKFYACIPQTIMPKDLGGEAPSFKELHEKMKRELFENDILFTIDKTRVVNESLRPGKPKNAGDLFGVEGSFKKLDID